MHMTTLTFSDGGNGPGWFLDRKGPFIYKEVTGNFAIVVQMRIGTADNIDAVPTGEFNSAGIVARDPSSYDPANPDAIGNERWLMYNIGYQAGGALQSETKTTFAGNNGSQSALFLTDISSNEGRLIMCRLGDTFHFFRNLDGDGETWTKEVQTDANLFFSNVDLQGPDYAGGFTRSDIGETVQLGLMANRWRSYGGSGVRVEFDYARFATPNSLEDCTDWVSSAGE